MNALRYEIGYHINVDLTNYNNIQIKIKAYLNIQKVLEYLCNIIYIGVINHE